MIEDLLELTEPKSFHVVRMRNEEWKWIDGFEGLYKISNAGRVKGYRTPSGRKRPANKRLLKRRAQVRLMNTDGTSELHNVARLVLLHFRPDEEPQEYVGRLNGVGNDRRVENLYWSDTESSAYLKSTWAEICRQRDIYIRDLTHTRIPVEVWEATRREDQKMMDGVRLDHGQGLWGPTG